MKDSVATKSPEFDVAYFREVLGGEYRRLTILCDMWEKRLDSDRELMSEDIQVKHDAISINAKDLFFLPSNLKTNFVAKCNKNSFWGVKGCCCPRW